jgi:predicted permease
MNEVSADAGVLFFTLALSTGTGLLCALVPLMHTRPKGLAVALNAGSTRGATASRHYIRRGLVVVQVALTIVIVVGAGLLLRTVSNLTTVDAGFDRSRLVTFLTTLPNFRYPDPASRAQLYRRLAERLRTIPGVQAASAMSGLPLNRPINAFDMQIEGGADPLGERARPIEYTQAVMSDYFETMRIPIVLGRAFQSGDAATPGLVAIVNETLAAAAWPDQNPIGRRVRRGDKLPWFTVIGVAKDVKQGGVDQPTRSEFYFLVEETGTAGVNWLFGSGAPGTMNLVLRTALPPAALSATIERIVREVDPAIPVVRLREMEDAFAESIRQPRLLAQLLAAFASLALLLAAIGIYGVLSYMVAERRREIGIRIALGAGTTTVLAKILKQGFVLTIVGTVAGIAGALGLSQLIASLLFGVRPTDIGTFAMVIMTILLVAAVACGVPAWRAARVDPIVALRYE